MAINSSSSVFHSQQSITSNLMCFISPNGADVFLVFTTTNIILILPLSILVLYVGFQRWRRQRSTSMVTSHADLFTYHMVVMEIFSLVGSGLYCNGNYTANHGTMMAGYYIFSLVLPGQALFHCLTCVDRYLAVVHPIIYLRLRNSASVLTALIRPWAGEWGGEGGQSKEGVPHHWDHNLNSVVEFGGSTLSLMNVLYC
ncbi:uncharacterized protein AKAME5_001938700 [Lates japonicus]|uniref:G-protein coupled receptors family 1 profile domain-containing protein n=1 Tax=Lates japonicus TaxID=270547 RepID=A0AAD3RF09_LATJO|nr:uncharacterized protein AKAME5_001938700 [Lates japonicus]